MSRWFFLASALTQPAFGAEPPVSEAAPGLFESAQSGAAPTPAPGQRLADERGALPIELGGYVRSTTFVGKVPERRRIEAKAGYAELALRLSTRNSGYADALAELRVRQGLQADQTGTTLDLREAYVNAYLGPLDLRVGYQIIVWGRADAFNPTSNLTPIDLRVRSPIEDDRRLGNVGVRAFLPLEPLRFEGVWLPLYTPSLLPGLAQQQYVTVSETDFPPAQLENGLGALRVHLELPAFEASVSYLHGYAPLPGFSLSGFTTGQDPPEVRIARSAYAQHVVGFDFSTALGDWVALRGEAAYRRPLGEVRQVYEPRPDLQYVLGADRAFGDVSVILQYIGRYVFDFQREPGPEDPVDPSVLARFTADQLPEFLEQTITSSINQELAVRNQIVFAQRSRVQHLVSTRIEWTTLHDTLSLSALGLINATTREVLVYPKLGYRASDALTLYVGAEIYAGPSGTLLGLIDETLSAGYAELRLGF